jgi:hypothetical protein
MPLPDAQAVARARAIELNVVGERVNDRYPKGTVILQTPVAGWRGGVDGPMRVTVSAGPTAPGPLGTPSSASGAAADVPCAPDAPRFVQGFAELQRQVGDPMGNPLRCEHPDPASGDMVQETSTGLAYYRRGTNVAAFTNGWQHWALTERGLVSWNGDSPDPPRR